MKKTTKLIFFFLICVSSFLYSQQNSGVITYGQRIIISDNSKSLKKSYFSDYYNAERKKMSESSKRITYKLRFNKLAASFSSERSMSIGDSSNDLEFAILHVNGDGERYFSAENNVSLWAHDVFGRDVILVDTINSMDWTITKETKKIGKYKVIKATKNKVLTNKRIIEIVAWFAPEIPNNYGPLGYYGLPGLILELQGRDFIIFATKVKFKKKSLHIEKPSKGDYMVKKEYDVYVDKAARDFIRN